MDSVLVGMFDSQADAQKARTALLSAGFDANAVSVTQGSTDSSTSAVDDTTPTMATASDSEHEGSITHFFKKLFGADTEESDTVGSGYSHKYNEAFRRGHYVVSVTTTSETEIDRAEQVMNAAGALDIDERAQQWQQSGWTGHAAGASSDTSRAASVAPETGTMASGSQTLKEVEEELKVGKRSVARGGVRVFTRLEEVPVQETVHLREEQADIQRRAVDRPASEADLAAFKEGSIELRNTAEEAVVSKSARVVGEVEIGKRVTERDEVVSDTVRKTRVDVEHMEGESALASSDTGREDRVGYAGTTSNSPSGSAHLDPLSGELGAHPVGTGVGAAAGGIAAGAAAGSVAGPIGTVAGAAVGAIAGGLAGKGVAEKADPTIDDRTDRGV